MPMKPQNIFLRIATVALFAISGNMLAPSGASATYSTYWADITADAGSFAPVALGESISLNACGSTMHLTGSLISYGNSVCNLNNIGQYSVNWFAKNITAGTFSWLTGGFGTDDNLSLASVPDGTAAANSVTTTGTGSGTFFDTVGTYAIGVLVATTQSANNVTYETVTNDNVNFYNIGIRFSTDNASNLGAALAAGGNLNQHAVYSSNFEVTAPVSVPEPESLLILLPALALMGMRERRRRKSFTIAA